MYNLNLTKKKRVTVQNRSKRNCEGTEQLQKRLRFAAGVLAAVLTVTAPFAGVSDVAFGASHMAGQELPAGGAMELVEEPVVRVISEGGRASLKSIRSELAQYDWDCYSNDYYYSRLSAKERQLYERLDAACGELLTSSEAAATYQVKKDGKTVTRYGTKKVSSLGLSSDQVKRVLTLFIYANPQYYFLNTVFYTTNNDMCAICVYDAFATGSRRAKETAKVRARLDALQAQVADNGCTYETEAQIHDLLCGELSYMSGDDALSDHSDPYYTQSAYGALMTGETVCAGYTKLYSMLCNYFGIDCIAVTSADHAWNKVRYGEHWYVVDVTWDDTSWDRSKYFHITDQRMKATDQDGSHETHSFYSGICPAADTEFSGSLMPMQGLAQPRVEVRDTAAGADITMSADVGTIYYTLDGTAPGSDDRYQGTIELTDGGTYVVTAMTACEGMISSAYEIFTVRIAGGSVRISSAANVSGKKIKVKLKATKSYTGYEVCYSSKKDFSNRKSSRIRGTSATISGLKKGKTYYIRVRGYKTDVYGNDYYTPYSKTKKVTITK